MNIKLLSILGLLSWFGCYNSEETETDTKPPKPAAPIHQDAVYHAAIQSCLLYGQGFDCHVEYERGVIILVSQIQISDEELTTEIEKKGLKTKEIYDLKTVKLTHVIVPENEEDKWIIEMEKSEIVECGYVNIFLEAHPE